jgi:hypothetical protein
MIITLISIALLLIVLHRLWATYKVEGIDDGTTPTTPQYTGYTQEETDLLTKNENNLAALKTQMDAITALQTTVDSIKSNCDANTTNINNLVDSCT